jgi:hypothetical protein
VNAGDASLPESLLRREARLRSWRWAFVVLGMEIFIDTAYGFGQIANYLLMGYTPRTEVPWEPIYRCFLIFSCVAVFWALSYPRPGSLPIIRALGGLYLALLGLHFGLSLLFLPEALEPVSFLGIRLEIALFPLVYFLAGRGGNERVYSAAALEEFAREGVVLGKENYWPGAATLGIVAWRLLAVLK